MRDSKIRRRVAPVAGAACVLGLSSFAGAAMYAGNGQTGFGGTLGNGSLSFSDDGAGNLTATFNPNGSFTGNDVVVYIDSTTGGFANTSTFDDNGDPGRTAVSAENSGNPSRVLVSFPAGFGADYAIEFENNTYIGLFGLAAGGNNSLNYITGATPTSGGPYTVTFPLADIGLSQGSSFSFDADLISTDAYGSNETVGSSVTVPDGTNPPDAAYNGSITFTAADTYTSTPVPEPTSMLAIAAGGVMLLRRRKV